MTLLEDYLALLDNIVMHHLVELVLILALLELLVRLIKNALV